MRKHLIAILVLIAAVALIVTACGGPPPTPVPTVRPTQPATSVPPTLPPTAVPPSPTRAPTMTPTTAPTATPAPPTPIPATPTRTRAPVTPRPAATATAVRPPTPKGSVSYHKRDGAVDRILVLNVESNITTALVDTGPVMDIVTGSNAHLGAFSPDNTRFAYIFTGSTGGSNVLRVIDFRVGGTGTSLFSSDPGEGVGLSSPTWSSDGRRIAFIRTRNNQAFWAIDVVNVDGSGRTDIRTNTSGEQYHGGISWSKLNVLAIAQNLGNPSDIFTLFTDGGGLTNLTSNPAEDTTPAWSPDGKLLAFTSNRDGRQQIYVMNADGTGLRRVSQGTANDFSPTWSPDGNWIAFASTREGSTDIYMMDLRGGNVKRLTTGGGDRPSWSR